MSIIEMDPEFELRVRNATIAVGNRLSRNPPQEDPAVTAARLAYEGALRVQEEARTQRVNASYWAWLAKWHDGGYELPPCYARESSELRDGVVYETYYVFDSVPFATRTRPRPDLFICQHDEVSDECRTCARERDDLRREVAYKAAAKAKTATMRKLETVLATITADDRATLQSLVFNAFEAGWTKREIAGIVGCTMQRVELLVKNQRRGRITQKPRKGGPRVAVTVRPRLG